MANLAPGIHNGLKLTKLEYTAKDTWEAIDFLFANDDGFFRHRVFKPKKETAEKVREHMNFIFGFFTDREKIKAVKGENFQDFATKLNDLYKAEKMWTKTVHIKIFQNEHGFAFIPQMFGYGFMQEGDIPCTLGYTDWEVENNLAPTMVPAGSKEDVDDSDDLPF